MKLPNKPKLSKQAVVCAGCGATHNEEKCSSCGRYANTETVKEIDSPLARFYQNEVAWVIDKRDMIIIKRWHGFATKEEIKKKLWANAQRG